MRWCLSSTRLPTTHWPSSKASSLLPSFMLTGAAAPPSSLMLSTEKFTVSSSCEMLGSDSDFLRGGFLGVLKEDLEKSGITIAYKCSCYGNFLIIRLTPTFSIGSNYPNRISIYLDKATPLTAKGRGLGLHKR